MCANCRHAAGFGADRAVLACCNSASNNHGRPMEPDGYCPDWDEQRTRSDDAEAVA
jgi:hypothetical protein